MHCFERLICPVCGAPLHHHGRFLQCPHRHTFDIAREGYVNLLVGKRPKTLGDEPDMVRARRRFLDSDAYGPLADALNRLAALPLDYANNILDAGCGEGYYLGRLQPHLASEGRCFFGLDVAKTAVRLAARRYPEACFLVADVKRHIPLPDASVGVLLNVFAPRDAAEFARVVAPGGALLVVIPQPGHLAALRERFALLDIEPDKRENVVAYFAADFALETADEVTIPLHLRGEALGDLVQMTPNAWHLTPAQWAQIHASDGVATEARFALLRFRRR